MDFELYIGSDRLDLFSDENISLNASVIDIKDIKKNTTEYTRSFTVPATNNNNNIFQHYYNSNIKDGFDARTSTKGRIQMGGIVFKEGSFVLNGVKIRRGKPDSYNINFIGRLLNLKNILKEDKLDVLDYSSYNHTYGSTNVRTGLTSSLSSGDIIYTPLPNKRYYYNNDATDNTNTAAIANIAFGGGAATGITWDEVKPAIKLLPLIELIETYYNITFSRDFFNDVEFDNLFLLVGNKGTKLGGGTEVVDFNGGDNTYMNHTTNIGTYPVGYPTGSPTSVSNWRFTLTVTPGVTTNTVPYRVKFYKDGVFDSSYYREAGGVGNYVFFHFGEDINNSVDVYFEIETTEAFTYTTSLNQRQNTDSPFTIVTNVDTTSSFSSTLNQVELGRHIPEIKIIDFLKGIFDMFNLVVIPQDNNEFYVNTLDDYYNQGSVLDISKYVDYNNYDVNRGDIINEISYQFEEPSTILNIEFQKQNGEYYGNERAFVYDESGDIVEGRKYDYKVPFEMVVYERLSDLTGGAVTEFQYGALIDDSLSPADIKPHIFYNINRSVGSKTIGWRDDLGFKTAINTTINTPSHTNADAPYKNAFLFGEEFNTWDGEKTTKNLYFNYHKTNIENVFNARARKFKFTAKNFPKNFIIGLNLNDTIKIRNDYYRISSYDLNITTGDVFFDLINITQ